MHAALTCHPDTPTDAVDGVSVLAVRDQGSVVSLDWRVMADPSRIAIPDPTEPVRAHELWRHTCVEMFVRAGSDAYYEFNFSPSQAWAAYRFKSYRSSMTEAELAKDPIARWTIEKSGWTGRVSVDLSGLAGLGFDRPLCLGLSAVVEERNGRQSLWALAHGPGKPDFHHALAFAADLPLTP